MSNKILIGGKNLFFRDGYIKGGFVYQNVAYPLFHQTQDKGYWKFLKSPNSGFVKDLKKLKMIIIAAKKEDRYNKYKEFFQAQNIPADVIQKTFELGNNDKAILQREELQEESKADDSSQSSSQSSSSPPATSSSSSEDEMTKEQLQKELDEIDKEIRETNIKIRAGGRRGQPQQMTRAAPQSIRTRVMGYNPFDEGEAMAAAPPGRRKANPTMNKLRRLTNRRDQIVEKMAQFVIKVIKKKNLKN